MKTHTNNYKNEIKKFGRQLDSKITYTNSGQTIELGKEQLNSITPHYEGGILKSVMKQLDIDSNVEIPEGTIIRYQFGVLVNNAYEYVDYGNYVVYKVEKQEDTRSYKITCYDKMLYSMVDYEAMEITYPITIKNYLSAVCNKLGLTLANDDFINNDKAIQSELYLDSDGNSLDYTFRDVLDEIAQATGSTICINKDDELEVRYITNAGEQTTTLEGTNLSIANCEDEKVKVLELQGNTTQEGTPTPSSPQPINVVSGRQEVVVAGKNLINPTITYPGTSNGITTTYNENQSLSFSGTTTGTWAYLTNKINTNIPKGDYTFSINKTVSAHTVIIRMFYNETQYQDITILKNTTSRTASVLNDTIAYQIYIAGTTSETQINDTLFFQLEKGSTPNQWEAYIGQSYEINLGKNLFNTLIDKSAGYTSEKNGITQLYNSDGSITLSGTATAQTDLYITNASYGSTTNNFILDNNTAYTLSLVGNTNNNIQILIGYGSSAYNTSTTKTITPNSNISWAFIRIANGTNLTTPLTIYPQLEKGSVATSYSPYKTPIELCKIGDYKDRIFRLKGINLFDKDNVNFYANNNTAFSNTTDTNKTRVRTSSFNINDYNIKTNTTYVVSGMPSGWTLLGVGTFTNPSATNTSASTTSNNTFKITDDSINYIYLLFGNNSSTEVASQSFRDGNIQLEKGTTATSYEPYGMYNKWYIEKQIGKVVLNGSEEDWIYQNNTFRLTIADLTSIGDSSIREKSNYYEAIPYNVSWGNYDYFISNTNGSPARIVIKNKDITSVNDFKTWLSTHNTIVYYVLATPTYTEITDSELIGQLNSIELIEGINNISISSGDLSSPLKLTYVSGIDTIDEEYLKDVNVNFGEKFGKVNSIVLSRSAESDNVYLRDEASVEANGLCEIKIKDNQIMNNNNRSDFLPGLLEALDGLYYYVNDFTSTGITYYDLCDRYNVSIDGNKYKCIMFNNEVDITQGLEEQVYTEMPEESETDYTKADKTDRKINQAYIIVDKQNQEINSVVQNINTLSQLVDSQGNQIDALGTRITQTTSEITASVSAIQSELDNGVNKVKTTSVTIDNSGLNVSTDTSKISTQMTNNAFEIKDSGNTTLAYFGYDEEEGISKSVMDNLTVDNYFIAGVHRVEKYTEDGEDRTGWFYIGG